MRLRVLGKSEIQIPAIVLGAMFRDPMNRLIEIEHALDCGLDKGLFAIDTAPLYGFGESETLLGRFVKKRHARMCLMTKVGLRWDDDWGDILFETQLGGTRIAVRRDSRPDAVRRDVEASLFRLRCDTLDLVQVHHRDPHTPIYETMGELLRLRTEGKLGAIGVSNFSAKDLVLAQDALGEIPLASTQNEYSLIERSAELSIHPAALALGTGLLAYSPLAQGLLAGRLLNQSLPSGDGRLEGALFQARNTKLIHRALRQAAVPIAERMGCGLGEVALGWLLEQSGVSAAIVGAQTESQVSSAAAAAELQFEGGEVKALGQAFAALTFDRHVDISWRRRARNKLTRLVRRVLR